MVWRPEAMREALKASRTAGTTCFCYCLVSLGCRVLAGGGTATRMVVPFGHLGGPRREASRRLVHGVRPHAADAGDTAVHLAPGGVRNAMDRQPELSIAEAS